jgi:hypothetical protein
MLEVLRVRHATQIGGRRVVDVVAQGCHCIVDGGGIATLHRLQQGRDIIGQRTAMIASLVVVRASVTSGGTRSGAGTCAGTCAGRCTCARGGAGASASAAGA